MTPRKRLIYAGIIVAALLFGFLTPQSWDPNTASPVGGAHGRP